MSGRKAGAMGLVERLAAALAVNEIVRSRRFLGEHTSKEDREELLKLTASELTSTAQVLASGEFRSVFHLDLGRGAAG